MKTEAILEHAEVAAVYLRALVDKGVPPAAAVSLTSAYVSSLIFANVAKDKPREPWEEQGP